MDELKLKAALATLCLDKSTENELNSGAFGAWEKPNDFFEKEKSRLIAEFSFSSLEDDLFILCNPDQVM